MRNITNFNRDWLFLLEDKAEFAKEGIEEGAFRRLSLPHDWSVDYPPEETEATGGGGGYGKSGTAWYRKHFMLDGIAEDEKLYLYFEGIYMDSTIYINGMKAGGHGYGYTSFYVDISSFVREGENLAAVRVNNSLVPNSRWYSGSGIYRDVYLVRTNEVHFDHFGVRCATNGLYPEQDMASLQIRSRVRNDSEKPVNTGVLHKVYDSDGRMVSVSGTALSLGAGETGDCMVRPNVEAPHLWTDEDPYLYTLVSTVIADGKETDSVTCRIGIRTACFDSEKGFLLNGKTVNIKGMCLHHDC